MAGGRIPVPHSAVRLGLIGVSQTEATGNGRDQGRDENELEQDRHHDQHPRELTHGVNVAVADGGHRDDGEVERIGARLKPDELAGDSGCGIERQGQGRHGRDEDEDQPVDRVVSAAHVTDDHDREPDQSECGEHEAKAELAVRPDRDEIEGRDDAQPLKERLEPATA